MSLVSRAAIAIVGGCAVVALVAGCGGSTSTSNNPPPSSKSVPTSDGNKQLPANWPADIPVPKGLSLTAATTIPNAMSITYTGPGTEAEMKAQMYPGMKAAGWTEKLGLDGGLSAWEKGTQRMQMTIVPQGSNVGVHMTIVQTTAS